MLARGIRTDSGSVASAMLTALLRSRLGFFGRVGFLDPFQLRGHYPPRGIAAIRAANVKKLRSGAVCSDRTCTVTRRAILLAQTRSPTSPGPRLRTRSAGAGEG